MTVNGGEQIIRGSRIESSSIAAEASAQQHIMLPSKFITHHPKAGLNPLVDAAAYLFSIIGKLKQLKSYRNLSKLQQELLQEVNTFQDAITTQGYTSEYILVSRYILCATLDDIIENTSWGSQGQWDSFNLRTTLNQDSAQQDRFFIIMDRISKEPALYIDVMELMYLCLNLGYKGSYRSTEFSQNQLEQITNALYKRIRTYRGDFTKTLSPFPIKTTPSTQKKANKKKPAWMIALATLIVILGLFTGLGYVLDSISNRAYHELMSIGKSLVYETTYA
jgi:type VI secretion system protein ImpK